MTITDANGCTIDTCSVVTVGFDDINSESPFIVYPNPTRDICRFPKAEIVQLFDFTGKLLLSKKEGDHVDLSSYPSGLYNLRLDEVFVRVIKE